MRTRSLPIDNRELTQPPIPYPRLTILVGCPVLPPRTGLNHKGAGPMTAAHNLPEMHRATQDWSRQQNLNRLLHLIVTPHLTLPRKFGDHPPDSACRRPAS